MIVEVRQDVIRLSGSLRENYWPALRSAVSLQLKAYPNGIIIDGSRLTEINEAGAHTFLEASEYIEDRNARVVISGLPEHILSEIRKIPGARSQLPLAATIEEARASLAVGGVEAVVEKKHRPVVLVPLVGDWSRALEYAAHHALDQRGEIHLLYIIVVPRAMPLGVPLPDKEREARETLNDAEQRLKRTGITVRKLSTRGRTTIEGLVHFAGENPANLVLVAYSKTDFEQDVNLLHSLLTAPCRRPLSQLVVFFTSPLPEMGSTDVTPSILVPVTGAWTEAVRFCAVHAAAWRAEMHLLYVIQVPRTLPLDAQLPEVEREADLTLGEAERMVKKHGLIVRCYKRRSRGFFDGIAKFATETKPRLIGLSYFRSDVRDEDSRYIGISTICSESPSDVAVVCLSGASPPSG